MVHSVSFRHWDSVCTQVFWQRCLLLLSTPFTPSALNPVPGQFCVQKSQATQQPQGQVGAGVLVRAFVCTLETQKSERKELTPWPIHTKSDSENEPGQKDGLDVIKSLLSCGTKFIIWFHLFKQAKKKKSVFLWIYSKLLSAYLWQPGWGSGV
jgi:hypothetical protein